MVGRVGFEPTTNWLKANCSTTELTTQKNGRGRAIRTPDILLPKQARYRTALYPGKKKAPSRGAFCDQCFWPLILRSNPSELEPKMVGRVGFEPTTNWLKANCSTN